MCAWGHLCRSSVCVSHSWPWAPIGDTYYMERYILPGALLQPSSLLLWLGCHSDCLIPFLAGSDPVSTPYPFLILVSSVPPLPHVLTLISTTFVTWVLFHMKSPEEVKRKSNMQTLLLFCWGFFSIFEEKPQKNYNL